MSLSIKDVSIVILAGGLATRLRPITEKIPKALVEVAGRPFIDWQLVLLYSQGIKHIVISIGYLGEMLREHVAKPHGSDCQVDFVFDGTILRGTGGAVAHCLSQLSDPFMVIYGDSYLPTDFSTILNHFDASRFDAQMSVFKNSNQFDTSNVDFRNGEILDYRKKNTIAQYSFIDWGLSVFTHRAFNSFKNSGTFDLSLVFQEALRKKRLQGIEVQQRFYEIGTQAGISDLEKYLMSKT